MFEKLKDNFKNCYVPYSHFKVSCCVVTKDNKGYFGVNVENASYGGTICAERVAILKAISQGEKPHNFKAIHILGSSEYTMPCFLCRQTFIEFFDKDVQIYVYNSEGKYRKYTMDEVCPLPFSKEDLK